MTSTSERLKRGVGATAARVSRSAGVVRSFVGSPRAAIPSPARRSAGSLRRRGRVGRPRAGRDRGVSEIVAIAILVGMVVTGAVLLASTGGVVIDDTRDRSESTAAVAALQEIDARLSTLSHGGSGDRTRLSVGTDDPDDFRVERSGSVTIEIDGGACNATVPLTAIRYETDGDTALTYEGGGIWRTDAGGTSLVTPPDLRYRNRTVRLSVSNLSGRIARSRVRATKLATSLSDTRSVERRLLADRACVRPDSVRITVRSDRYRAWGRYMADEFGLRVGRGVRLDGPNRTASATLPQRMLPREADDDRNRVIDFAGGYGRHHAGTVSVDKGSPSLTYPVSITVLGDDTQGGRPTVTVHRDRRPLDVAFVVDESSSMRGGKLADTRVAATGFVDELNASAGDRVGVVGYSDAWPCRYRPDACPTGYLDDARVHAGFPDDADDAVDSIEDDLWAFGDTPIAAGIDRTTALFADEGRDSAERVVVLLSDGRHNGGGNVTAAAERAAARNVTIYAVGFGDDAEEATLRTIANATGGAYYHAGDAAELRDRFERIAVEITETRWIRPRPVTVRAGPATLHPDGSARPVPPNGTAHDLNDPGVSVPIAYASELDDGRRLPLTLTYWDCETWAPTNETVSDPDGHEYRKARCLAAPTPNASVNATSSPDRVRGYTAANTTADLPDGTGSWVESNVTEILRANGYVDASGNLSLASNQVVVVYDLPEGSGVDDYNDEVVVVEVGYATDEVRVGYAVSVTVSDVRLGTTS